MITHISHVTLVVRSQDEALAFYTEKLGFEKRADDRSVPGFRWVTVAPPGQREMELVLLEPGPEQAELRDLIGHQSHWVLATDDCRETVTVLKGRGVKVAREAEDVPWGVQAIIEDLYGNALVLVQPRGAA